MCFGTHFHLIFGRLHEMTLEKIIISCCHYVEDTPHICKKMKYLIIWKVEKERNILHTLEMLYLTVRKQVSVVG